MNYDGLYVFDSYDREYKNLETIARNLNAKFAPDDYRFEIETVYFDVGQDWRYTTIIVYDQRRKSNDVTAHWHLFNPAQQKIACYGGADDLRLLVSTIITNLEERRK